MKSVRRTGVETLPIAKIMAILRVGDVFTSSQLLSAPAAVELTQERRIAVVSNSAASATGLDRVLTLRARFGDVCHADHLLRDALGLIAPEVPDTRRRAGLRWGAKQ